MQFNNIVWSEPCFAVLLVFVWFIFMSSNILGKVSTHCTRLIVVYIIIVVVNVTGKCVLKSVLWQMLRLFVLKKSCVFFAVTIGCDECYDHL